MADDVTAERIREVDNNIKNGGSSSVSPEQQMENVKRATRDADETSGVRDLVSANNSTGAGSTANEAPPKASAAPKGDSNNNSTSLCDWLNEFQEKLVSDGVYEIADQYEIVLLGGIGDATVSKEGGTNQAATSMPANNTAKQKVDPNTNSMDTTSRVEQLVAGRQVIAFIESIVRNSSYITDQQKTQTSEVTGETTPNANAKTGDTKWFKISTKTEVLGWDKKRNDNAYKITYIVAPYVLSDASSEYFNTPKFKGVQKSYKYWFTGENTSILNYEVNYNNLWFRTLTDRQGTSKDASAQTTKSKYSNPMVTNSYQAASGQNNQGAKNNANEAAANLADYLYDFTSIATTTIRIVGDPAWLVQGEVSGTIDPKNYNYAAFLPDGTINSEYGQIMFDITWAAPVDYNFDTGIMDVTAPPQSSNGESIQGQMLQNFVYTATNVKSFFRGGKFEQELVGSMKISSEDESPESDPDGRPAASESTTREPQTGKEEATESSKNPNQGSPDASGSDRNSGTTPAAIPAEPSSNGAVVPQGSSGTPTSQEQQMANVKQAYRESQTTQQMAAKDA